MRDKRLSRGERSGRYGGSGSSDGNARDNPDRHETTRRNRDAERDCDRRWGDERHRERERFDAPRRGRETRDSPEQQRVRKRRHSSDRSDDEYDGDPDQDYKMEQDEEESKTIMLRGLSLHITEDEIRTALEQLQGPQPVDIRLMKKRTGISRGFAFVEFYHLQDATRWMETNQHNKLMVQGKSIAMHYSNRRQHENWLCSACGLYNFRKRLKCFRCGAVKTEGDSAGGGATASGVNSEPQHSGDYNGDTIILRNVAPHSTVDAILILLAPYANLNAGNIRLIKDKQTRQNRGFAFVQLSSPLEASQLLTILQSLQPPLKLDGKTIGVDYAKSARKDSVQADGIRANALSVASTAIAAAQWSSSQLQQGSGSASDSMQDGYAQCAQTYQLWPQQPEALAPVIGDGLLGAAPGVIPAVTGVLSAQVYQPLLIGQSAIQAHQYLGEMATSALQAGAAGAASLAASSTAADPNTSGAPPPDTSTYQYDESSGYYYDPQTGLYYDPNSQYYYNSQTQQYLYWDSEQHMYVPAPDTEQASAAGGGAAGCAASGAAAAATAANKEPKEKKEKPKSKSAQQIAKDMERWAKTLNKQKESFKSGFQTLGCPGSREEEGRRTLGPGSREEEGRESAAADAGFTTLFEKKQNGGFEVQAFMHEHMKIIEQQELLAAKSGLVTAYNEDSDPEEGSAAEHQTEEETTTLTDWTKMACLLCRRQFPNKEALLRHQQLSDLHKQNLEIQRRSKLSEAELEELERTELKYRDRAAERREKYGVPEPPAPKKTKKFYQPPTPTVNYEQPTKDGLTSDNIGNKMLQAMGWQEGKGLGRHQQGITAPIAASLRTKGTGLGIKGSAYELSASDTYKDAVRKAMFARFTEIE